MRSMGVKGLTLFHVKSHLQKYRIGKQTGKENLEQSKDGSYHLDNPTSGSVSPIMSAPDVTESQEVNDALRAQMEVQRKLHEQVEIQKHVEIRVDACEKYLDSLIEKACRMASEQATINDFTSTRLDLPNGFTNMGPDLPVPGGFTNMGQDLPDLASGSGSLPWDPSTVAAYNQLSVGSISLHGSEGSQNFHQ